MHACLSVAVGHYAPQELFVNDMQAIRRFLTIVSPKHLFTLSQLEKQLGPECDYRIEAATLQEVADNMTGHGFMPKEVVVPRPLLGLSTGRMLVMELLDGPKLTDGLRMYAEARAKAEGKTVEQLRNEQLAATAAAATSAPSPASAASTSAAMLSASACSTLTRWRDGGYNLGVWLLRACGSNLPYRSSADASGDAAMMSAYIPRMVDVLMRVHGAQLLQDGLFNADPNGGNFLLLRDGRIGLIDYGATKRLTREERLLGAVRRRCR